MIRRSLLLSVLIASAVCPLSGCRSEATMPEAESLRQEAKDLQDAIDEIQNDKSLSAREKERAIKPLRERLGRIPQKGGE